MDDITLQTSTASTSTSRPTNEHNTTSYRLLYRGAISLPDSHLLLDGLTFIARLDTPSKNNHLLDNPLALSLESMRGRPSLRLMGVVKLKDDKVTLDESGCVELDIHPRAILTRIYFENIFCLSPFASASTSNKPVPGHKSDVGIKVALGETDGPDTTQVVIYARTSGHRVPKSIDLVVARISPRSLVPPKVPAVRVPRPDDPTPRKPPVVAFGAGRKELKRAGSSLTIGTGAKRKKLNGDKKDDALFKVPDVPPAKGKEKKQVVDEDVFGATHMVASKTRAKAGKSKETTSEREVEQANKKIIKRAIQDYLQQTNDPTGACVGKSHPEFKGIFNHIYSGITWALRSEMQVHPVNLVCVLNLVQRHAVVYVDGRGGVDAISNLSSMPYSSGTRSVAIAPNP